MARIDLAGYDLVCVRAANPGPFTLTGTNSWLIGREPTWLIDPGPALEDHLEELRREIERRGGLGGVALTHDHPDHVEALPGIRDLYPGAPVAGSAASLDVTLAQGSRFGPLLAVATPGHAPDHLAYVVEDVAFTGDAVLGEGSVFISPYPGALRAYLAGLQALRGHPLARLCPGHGPPVHDPAAKLDEYVAHRLERERRLVGALEAGRRSVPELLDDAWSDVPGPLRPAAAWTLAAHLDKLGEEDRLPADVARPAVGPMSAEGGSAQR